jgi:hypothetical protein
MSVIFWATSQGTPTSGMSGSFDTEFLFSASLLGKIAIDGSFSTDFTFSGELDPDSLMGTFTTEFIFYGRLATGKMIMMSFPIIFRSRR